MLPRTVPDIVDLEDDGGYWLSAAVVAEYRDGAARSLLAGGMEREEDGAWCVLVDGVRNDVCEFPLRLDCTLGDQYEGMSG